MYDLSIFRLYRSVFTELTTRFVYVRIFYIYLGLTPVIVCRRPTRNRRYRPVYLLRHSGEKLSLSALVPNILFSLCASIVLIF